MKQAAIVRVYNNNLVLARDEEGHEALLMGRALGYARHQGDPVDLAAVEMRFVPQDDTLPERLANSLTGASVTEAKLGRTIVGLAQRQLGFRASQAVELAVIDHLVFAIRRARQGSDVAIPLSWEVRQLYPAEVAAGREALTLVETETGVRLPPDEAVAFALHFVSAQLSSPDLTRTVAMTNMIATVWDMVTADRALDADSVAAARFVAHVRHLVGRLHSHRRAGDAPSGLAEVVAQLHPDVAPVARSVALELERRWGQPIAEDEEAYLGLHIGRLWAESDADEDLD